MVLDIKLQTLTILFATKPASRLNFYLKMNGLTDFITLMSCPLWWIVGNDHLKHSK